MRRRAKVAGIALGAAVALAAGVVIGTAFDHGPTRVAHVAATRAATTTTTQATTTIPYVPASVRPPLVVHLTNDIDLEAALGQASRDTAGQTFSGDGPRFVTEYHASERAFQQAEYDGRTAYVPAAPYSAAVAFVKRQHPQEVYEHEMLEQMNNLNRVMTSPSPSTACYGCSTTTSTTRYGF